MKKYSITFFLFILLLCNSIIIFAQQEKGDFQITPSGNLLTQSGFTNILISVKFSKYFTKNIEVGISPQANIGTGSGSTVTTLGMTAYGAWNFFIGESSKFIPSAGVQTSILAIKGITPIIGAGPYASVKYFFNEKISLDFTVQYSFSVESDRGDIARSLFGVGILF